MPCSSRPLSLATGEEPPLLGQRPAELRRTFTTGPGPAEHRRAGQSRASAPSRPPGAPVRAAEAVVYCMNEAELVDVALAVLAENLQCEEGEEKAPSPSEEEREHQATPAKAPGSTASAGEAGDRGPALPSPPDTGAGAYAERTGREDTEEDALKYVREIFFS
ncbi:cell cycle regulator of non-homologous end joining-like isoform X1 [Tyto alba]|uniref:cell cycle regulator of non-homologous end joining n=1 Tax=Tyto alba TaxID=56313 RepID=UPI001C66CC51|nr:cell cycle regulator of non-homologous end joining-like isoform X1 [Tyto alba]XP_042648637.1 cell cycle regulator of non-homologous end joining-like isoform X1 [Tyto alba]XP_042648639.1 cell cycle regulator of non-homologous end joining [Tyto alba]XP_042648640.1 cell cycle regulator of non-homologous end joining-like isoform X1 [Tyto alba]